MSLARLKPRGRRAAALLLAVACAACSEEQVNPLGIVGSSSSGGGGEAGQGGSGPKVRDVFVRNPLGLPHQNLLADGDFELSIVPEGSSGQYGWVAFSSAGGQASILGETGGLCRSGLRCGRVQKNAILFARGTAAAAEQPHRASIFAKPTAEAPASDQPCDLLTAYVVQCDSFDILEKLQPATQPGADGYCELSAETASSTLALCMYVEVDFDVLVDQATLVAAPELGAKTRARIVAPADVRKRMSIVKEQLRTRLPLGAAPKSPEQRMRELDPR